MQVSSPATDVVALSDAAPIPGLGFLPVNAYVLHAQQPVLVDSGLPASRADFLEALWNQVDPADLRTPRPQFARPSEDLESPQPQSRLRSPPRRPSPAVTHRVLTITFSPY